MCEKSNEKKKKKKTEKYLGKWNGVYTLHCLLSWPHTTFCINKEKRESHLWTYGGLQSFCYCSPTSVKIIDFFPFYLLR